MHRMTLFLIALLMALVLLFNGRLLILIYRTLVSGPCFDPLDNGHHAPLIRHVRLKSMAQELLLIIVMVARINHRTRQRMKVRRKIVILFLVRSTTLNVLERRYLRQEFRKFILKAKRIQSTLQRNRTLILSLLGPIFPFYNLQRNVASIIRRHRYLLRGRMIRWKRIRR